MTPAQNQRRRRARDLAIAHMLMVQGASLRRVAELFAVSPATVSMIKMKYVGPGPVLTAPSVSASPSVN